MHTLKKIGLMLLPAVIGIVVYNRFLKDRLPSVVTNVLG
jgi:putative effector of murein hydrolase LrgA (UPF0299 family)